MNSRYFRLWAVLALVALCKSVSLAGDLPEQSELEEVPVMLLAVLHDAEINLDSDSLLSAAKAHQDLTVRWVAIEILGHRRVKEARLPLLDILGREEDYLIRETAALALARIGEEAGLVALEKFMVRPADRKDQLFLATRLAELGQPTGYRYVLEVLKQDDDPLKLYAVEALGEFLPLAKVLTENEITPVQWLFRLAEDPDSEVRGATLTQFSVAVYRGLLELGEVRPLVERLAQEDDDPEVREQAAHLLESWRFEKEQERRSKGGRDESQDPER